MVIPPGCEGLVGEPLLEAATRVIRLHPEVFEALFEVHDGLAAPRRSRFGALSECWSGVLMCRVLAYLGSPVLIDELLFAADVSLVRQATEPRMMALLNLGGFGLAAWDQGSPDPARPFTYRTAGVPMFDRNLKSLASKVRASALLAHVRGVVYDPGERVGVQQAHPFLFDGAAFALAMNGDLFDFARMRYDLLEHIPAGAELADRGHDRQRVVLRARARAARRTRSRHARRGRWRRRRGERSRSCARCASVAGSIPSRRSTSCSATVRASSPPGSCSTTAGTRKTTRSSPQSANTTTPRSTTPPR